MSVQAYKTSGMHIYEILKGTMNSRSGQISKATCDLRACKLQSTANANTRTVSTYNRNLSTTHQPASAVMTALQRIMTSDLAKKGVGPGCDL